MRYGIPSSRVGARGSRNVTSVRTEFLGPILEGFPDLIAHHRYIARNMLPPSELFTDIAESAVWDLENTFPRAGYRFTIDGLEARWLAPLQHQSAVFWRGDTAVVISALDLPAHGIEDNGAVETGMIVNPLDGAGGDPVRGHAVPEFGSNIFVAQAAPGPATVSIEALVPDEAVVGRARFQLDLAPPRGTVTASGLLLVHGDGPMPDTLAAAIPLARASRRVMPGERVGLFWEVYGLAPNTTQWTVSVRLEGERPGFLRRLVSRIGLGGGDRAASIRWDEPVSPASVVARSVAIDVPDLADGSYPLEIVIEIPGQEPIELRTELEVARVPVEMPAPGGLRRRPFLFPWCYAGNSPPQDPARRMCTWRRPPPETRHRPGLIHGYTWPE